MPKFKAPDHITRITLSSGEVDAVDGVLEIHEPNVGDVAQLNANGFTLIVEGAYFALPAPEPEPEPEPVLPAPATKAKPAKAE